MAFPRALLCVGVPAATWLAAGRASAQEATSDGQRALPVEVTVTTNGACPATRFREQLDARVRRPITVRDGAPTSLRIVVSSAGAALEGTAYFTGASGKDSRAVRGTCEEISAALALVATTWVEAEPAVPELAAPPAGSSAGAERAPPATPDAPRTEPPTVASPTTSATTRPRADTDADADTRREPALPTRRFALGAQGFVSVGLVGGPAAGGGIAIAHTGERVELRAGARVAFGGDTVTAGSARYVWLTAPIDGCLRVPTGPTFPVAACARVEPGAFNASFAGSDRLLAWLGLGAGARVGWAQPAFRIELEGFIVSPVTGYRITPTETTLMPFRAVAPALAAGIMVPFS